MPGSLVTLPLRVSVRCTRSVLRTTREAADLGLAALELVGRALGEGPDDGAGDDEEIVDAPAPVVVPDLPAEPGEPDLVVTDIADADLAAMEPDLVVTEFEEPDLVVTEFEEPDLVVTEFEEPELVEEVADPGAEDGAGATIRIDPPFAGYDELRAADVVAHLRGVDDAELAETELYEHAHRARRTVLDAITREHRRRSSR